MENLQHIYNCSGHELKIPNIVNSRGMYVFDAAGKRYMDMESGVWCTSLGHNHERINAVITSQINSLMHAGFCYSHEVVQAAAAILSLTHFDEGKCVFLCSGSEAIELSRQIAKHLTGRKRSMTLHDSYLGSYSSVINRRDGWYILNWNPCKQCEQQEHCDPACAVLQTIPDDISDFIFEPGSSSGFVRFPPKAMIHNVVKRIRNNHGKVIANEVTTGVGRTGKWFGYQHYAIEPDLVAIGKGIGNGYPVSVTAIHPTVIDELERLPFKYAQSHQNDPLGAAVVREVVQTIQDEDLIAKAAARAPKYLALLQSLVDHDAMRAVRGRGLMFGVDLADESVGNAIFNDLLDRGYIVCNRKALFRIDPPLIVTDAEFEAFVEAFRASLAAGRKPA
jgi:acetylornithine/N-succinyldiaminopimelate aminotransferase